MSLRVRAMLWLGAALFALSGCSSFSFSTRSDDLKSIQSVFVIVSTGSKLEAGECSELVRPERQDDYYFYAQFVPRADGEAWEQAPNAKGGLKPDVDGKSISLTIAANIMEALPDGRIAVVARMADDNWYCDKAALVAKGDATFVIGPKGLERLY